MSAGIENDFSENLKYWLKVKGITQRSLAEFLNVTEQTITNYSKGYNSPRLNRVDHICKYLGLNRTDLLDSPSSVRARSSDILSISDVFPIKKTRRIPILGEIAYRDMIWRKENYEGVFVVDAAEIYADFAVRAKGDSMTDAGIHDGDLVFLRRTPDVENGTIAAIFFADECTLKRYYREYENHRIVLRPCNSDYDPIIIIEEDMEFGQPHILGEFVGVYHPAG